MSTEPRIDRTALWDYLIEDMMSQDYKGYRRAVSIYRRWLDGGPYGSATSHWVLETAGALMDTLESEFYDLHHKEALRDLTEAAEQHGDPYAYYGVRRSDF